MKVFPFENSERMIRKNFHSLYSFQRTDKISQAMKVIVTIIALRYQYMANPHGYAHIGKFLRHGKDIFVGTSCEDLVLFLINMFDIQHDKICIFHQLFPFFMPWALFCVRIAAGIKCCVDSKFLGFLKKLSEEIDL